MSVLGISNYYQLIMEINYPGKNDLILMLQKEEEIRMSQKYIDLCDEVKDEPNGWLRISEEIQYQIARDFGYTSKNGTRYSW